MSDESFMRRAIALAAGHLGRTGDNPSVGCVLVNGGDIVGEGVTGIGGRPHAEEQALVQAGERARGGVAYVTLEPCGERSSGAASCSNLLIKEGISRVVVAATDPSHLAAGRGPAALQAAGIVVETGLLADEAAALYSAYSPASAKPLETGN